MPILQCDVRKCPKCGREKPFAEYYKNKSNKHGMSTYCKECHYTASHNSPNRKAVASVYYNKRKLDNPQLFMWKQARHRAQWDYDNMEFTIHVEDIKIPEKCPYMQRPFVPLDKDMGYSLDRIDSNRGYTKDNIQVISAIANKMKNNATEEQLIAFAKGVLVVHTKEGRWDADTSM